MGHYLAFELAGETCAVPVQNVQTVLESVELCRVSGAPEYVAGLLDLRGEAIPVIDVRRKLGLEGSAGSGKGCIIVMALEGTGPGRPVGALVDAVSEVVEIDEASISPAGDFAVSFDPAVVRGIASSGEGFVTIVAIKGLLAAPAQETAAAK